MKIGVISYSFTGNNEAIAIRTAEELTADHIKVTESKPRTPGRIFMDLILKRTPKISPAPDIMKPYDLVLFFGPVWIEHPATPLRAYFNFLKTISQKYAFISISGGADSNNPKLSGRLNKLTGKVPIALIDLHIADLLPPEPKPTRNDTSSYKLKVEDINKLTGIIVKTLREKI